MKKLVVHWINPKQIPRPPKRESGMDLVCHSVRACDKRLISSLGLTYKPDTTSSHGWVWVRNGDVEPHADSDRRCLLMCASGSGVFMVGDNVYPMVECSIW